MPNLNHKESSFAKSNIDFLRLLLASVVVIAHSLPLSGSGVEDPLLKLTDGQISVPYIAVRGFFVLSGYLIFNSLMQSKGLMDYFWKRALRILPGYWMVILLTVFVVGPVVADISVKDYFSQSSTWNYLKGTLTMRQIFAIDHVLQDVPYKHGINGSLWTIAYEMLMYVAIAPLFFLRHRKKLILLLVSLFFACLTFLYSFPVEAVENTIVPFWAFTGVNLVDLPVFFFGGTFLACLGSKWEAQRPAIFGVATLALIIAAWLGGLRYTLPLAFPVWIMTLAQMSFPVINNVRVMGDFSYGIYLYGFLVQQILMHYFHFGLVELVISSLLVSTICGALSWHLLEKHALRLKSWKWWMTKGTRG